LKRKDEKILIKKCKDVRADLLQAKMAGILYKLNGLEPAIEFLDSITVRGVADIGAEAKLNFKTKEAGMYLIKKWIEDSGKEPKIELKEVYNENEIWSFIQDAEDEKYCIYEMTCLLDKS